MPINDISRLSPESISDTFGKALAGSIISGDDTAAVFIDLTFLKKRAKSLQALFGENCIHTMAIKANPLVTILGVFRDLGFGAEAASLPELYIARAAGIRASNTIFDSPVKTIAELQYAINTKMHINSDSLAELERIDRIRGAANSRSTFGLRINPQVGAGRIKMTSVAGEYSKFGVPLNQYRAEIIEAYLRYPWLTGIHLHIGSQGIPLDLLVKGAELIFELTKEINQRLAEKNKPNRINIFDIGGGMPVTYRDDLPAPTIDEYVKALHAKIPQLFDGEYKLITEFGRYLNANCGWAISRVEYVKKQGDINTALIHLGADMFIRRCYNPDDWHHDILVIDSNGKLKSGSERKYVIAGPLCFAGDIIAHDIDLPEIEPGDYIVIRDVGAYTYSMWSRYNSRQMPIIVGYNDNGHEFSILRKRESLDDIYRFWQ